MSSGAKQLKLAVVSTSLSLATTLALLSAGCGSGGSGQVSTLPDTSLTQTEISQDQSTLQVTTRPVIYQPLLVVGNPGSQILLTGTGFSNVVSVIFFDRTTRARVEADFRILGDNRLAVEIPDDVTAGFIQVRTPFNAAVRGFRTDLTFPTLPPLPGVPTLSVNDVSVNESAGTASFTVSLSGASAQNVSFTFATSNGTAIAGSDYTATNVNRTINAGSTSTTITVPILEDQLDEPNETFNVTLSAPSNATIADGTGIGTITDNDDPAPLPTLSVNDVSVNENAGTASFTVSLSGASTQNVSFTFATSNGTATAGSDYTATNVNRTINAGSTSTTITVPILEDQLDEPNETFNVTLSAPSNATIADGTGIGTITDNDDPAPLPTLSVNDVSVNENAGTASFTVSLSGASTQNVSFTFATSNGTATAGSDYTATNVNRTINAGSTSTTITVPILEDQLDEPNETFNVTLSAPSNATIADGTGIGTIQDNDEAGTEIIFNSTVPLQDSYSFIQFSIPISGQGAATLPQGSTFNLESPNASMGMVTYTNPLEPGGFFLGFITFSCTTATPPNTSSAFNSISINGLDNTNCVYVHIAAQGDSPDVTNIAQSQGCPAPN